MTIYILTDGDYSDYHIIGVFSSEEAGRKAQKEFGGDFESYELDELGKDNRLPYQVILQDGSDTRVFGDRLFGEMNKVRKFGPYGSTDYNYSVTIMAEDKEHAVKIASDLIAQYKALPIQR